MAELLLAFLQAPKSRRTCGECQACCYAIGVEEIEKPFTTRCEHQCDKGCGIYKNRPGSCASYECAWLAGLGDDEDRPDKLGVVVHQEIGEEGLWIDLFLLNPANTYDEKRVEQLVNRVLRETLNGQLSRGVRFVLHDQIRNAAFTINVTKYERGGNHKENTPWLTMDNKTYYLFAPLRGEKKRRVGLPMAHRQAMGERVVKRLEEQADALADAKG